MKELVTGTFSNKDIADCFGIKQNTFYKNKEKKLKELKNFANYEITPTGKIKIKEVKIPVYVKPTSKAFKYYLETVPKAWTYDEPETCSRVAAKIFDPKNNIQVSTGYEYTRMARDELWGKPDKENPKCKHKLAKMYRGQNPPEDNIYIAFTDEDYKIHEELFQEYIAPNAKTTTDIILQVKDKELDKEQAFDILFPEKSYKLFLSRLAAKLGCDWIVNSTIVNRGKIEEESAF